MRRCGSGFPYMETCPLLSRFCYPWWLVRCSDSWANQLKLEMAIVLRCEIAKYFCTSCTVCMGHGVASFEHGAGPLAQCGVELQYWTTYCSANNRIIVAPSRTYMYDSSLVKFSFRVHYSTSSINQNYGIVYLNWQTTTCIMPSILWHFAAEVTCNFYGALWTFGWVDRSSCIVA